MENYNRLSIATLKDECYVRNIKIPHNARKLDLVKLLEEDDYAEMIDNINFDEVECIGTGAMSVVYAINMNNKRYAYKKFKPDIKPERIEQELKYMNMVKECPYIVQALYHDVHGVLMERCAPMVEFLESRLTMRNLRRYFKDIALGIQYIHLQGYAIMDIKPSNMVINEGHGMLIDVGSLVKVPINDPNARYCFTIRYAAPEVLIYPRGVITTSCDVWSFGVSLYSIWYEKPLIRTKDLYDNWVRQPLFNDSVSKHLATMQGMYDFITQEFDNDYERFDEIPDEYLTIVEHCLVVDAEERWTMNEVIDAWP